MTQKFILPLLALCLSEAPAFANIGIANLESADATEFHCDENSGRPILSERTATWLLNEYAKKEFPNDILDFVSVKINPEADGSNEVLGYTYFTKICPQPEVYSGVFVVLRVCGNKLVQSGFYCDDY